jgi:hypothetical protein
MSYSITPEPEQSPAAELDQMKVQQLLNRHYAEQSLGWAILAGLMSSILAAVLWALVTYATGYQIGFMAVGVGFLVGYTVRYFGNGLTNPFGITGAAFSLFGCLLGNVLASFIALSQIEGSSVLLVLSAFVSSPGIVVEIMKETFSPIDLLFYGIAIYEGYKLSFSGLSPEEIASVQSRAPQT